MTEDAPINISERVQRIQKQVDEIQQKANEQQLAKDLEADVKRREAWEQEAAARRASAEKTQLHRPAEQTVVSRDTQPLRPEARKTPNERIAEIRKHAKDARQKGQTADIQKIADARSRVEGAAKRMVEKAGGAGADAAKAGANVARSVEVGAQQVVAEGWVRTEQAASKTGDALELVGKTAFEGTKKAAIVAAVPVVVFGQVVDHVQLGLREIGKSAVKTFSDAKENIQHMYRRGAAMKDAAVQMIQLIGNSEEQKLIKNEFAQKRAMRDLRHQDQVNALRARSPFHK